MLESLLTKLFSCEYCETFKNSFFYRTAPVAASAFSIFAQDVNVKRYLPILFSIQSKFKLQNELKIQCPWILTVSRRRRFLFSSRYCNSTTYWWPWIWGGYWIWIGKLCESSQWKTIVSLLTSNMVVVLLLTLLMIKQMNPVTIIRRKRTNLNRKRWAIIWREMIKEQIIAL